MRGMAVVTVAVIALVLTLLYAVDGMVSIHFYIATALGIGLTMMLAGALMGLVFLSNGTGHDKAIINPFEDDQKP